jgi:hypothetical protein
MVGILRWLAALVAGVAIGAGSLYYATFMASPAPMVINGAWRMNPLAGSAANDPYSRLQLAVTSILALARSETVYFEARTDDAGGKLNAACDFLLTGAPPDARWWSVTAYGPDDMLIPTESARYSATAHSTAYPHTPPGLPLTRDIEIALTPDGSGPNGIATGSSDFVLLLRLYQPAKAVADAPESAPVFRITRGNCRA